MRELQCLAVKCPMTLSRLTKHFSSIFDCFMIHTKKGIITREQAKREKSALLRTYESNKLLDDISKEWIRSMRDSEIARANYRKNKTIENADKMLAALEGRKNVS